MNAEDRAIAATDRDLIALGYEMLDALNRISRLIDEAFPQELPLAA